MEFVPPIGLDELDECPTPALVELLAGLQRFRNQLDSYEAQVTAVATRRRSHHSVGARDMAGALTRAGGISRREANRRERLAETVAAHPVLAEAMGSGAVTGEQAAVLGAAQVPEAVRAELIEEAAGQGLEATRAAVRAAEAAHRTEDAAERDRRLRARRRARRWIDDEGLWHAHLVLDPTTGATVDAAWDQLTDRLFHTDKAAGAVNERDHDQRRADALAESITRPSTTTAGPPPRLDVVIPHTWLGGDPDVCGRADSGVEISATALEQLACDCELLATVIDPARGEVLHHGRSRRVVTPAQRRALVARDAGCVIPWCNAPPSVCHAHHLIHWLHGGVTDLPNLGLVCHHHHTWLHASGHRLRREPDATWTVLDPRGAPAERHTPATALLGLAT